MEEQVPSPTKSTNSISPQKITTTESDLSIFENHHPICWSHISWWNVKQIGDDKWHGHSAVYSWSPLQRQLHLAASLVVSPRLLKFHPGGIDECDLTSCAVVGEDCYCSWTDNNILVTDHVMPASQYIKGPGKTAPAALCFLFFFFLQHVIWHYNQNI